MSSIISSRESEHISDFEKQVYANISKSLVKYLLGREWLDSEEIKEALVYLCNELKTENIDRDIAYATAKHLVAAYVESELNTMLDKHLLNTRYPQIDFGQLSFSQKFIKGFS